MKNTILKRIAMVAVTIGIVVGTGAHGHINVEAAKVQMMEICCPHCHEIITVNVLLDDVECCECHENIHIDG